MKSGTETWATRRKFLTFFALFLFNSNLLLCRSQNTNFNFPSFSLQNLTLLGDSYLRDGRIGLTREQGVPCSSSGTAIFNKPIRFSDRKSNTTSSFTTRFTFQITNLNPSTFGDGLSFFISPTNSTLGSPGGYLGLVNSSDLTQNRFIAIEFDTRLDIHFSDPNQNHVGFNIDSLDSIKTVDPISIGINFKSQNPVTTWVEYNSPQKAMTVFLSYNSSNKPLYPILNVDVDLSNFLQEEFLYAGFSGSTTGSTELHTICSWAFSTCGLNRRPRLHLHNVSDSSVISFSPPNESESQMRNAKSYHRLGMGFTVGGPTMIGIAIAILGYIGLTKWRHAQEENGFPANLFPGPREFTYKELNSATNGFDSNRVMGCGAFGTVYKAFFVSTGTISAVKRSKHTHEGKSEFVAELSTIACLRHKNLVQLQGWCAEKDELILVYDFMANGSLDKILYSGCQGKELKWSHRYNIATGLASVLAYLHQECEQQVIHRDVKTSNIMLDGSFNARLGDFGLARLMDHDKSPESTLTAGTMGYLAPEYLQYGKATEKTDVFSYGVVILETACGRRPIEEENDMGMVNLVDYAWSLYSEGRLVEAADKRLEGEFEYEQMRRMLMIGLACANPDSSERPTMRKVFQMLSDEAKFINVPTVKPSMSFSSGIALTLDEIVSDREEGCGTPGAYV